MKGHFDDFETANETRKEQFGNIVRELRNKEGFTETELASIIGVTSARISDIEKANKTNPKLEEIARPAKLLVSVAIN